MSSKAAKALPYIVGAGLAYVAYRSYYGVKNAVANLQYDFGGFSLDKKNTTLLKGIAGILTFRVTNNRDVMIPLKSFIGEIKYNDKVIANIRTKSGQDIPLRANATTNVNINVQIKPLQLLSLGFGFLKKIINGEGSQLQPFVVTGQLATSIITIPINESFKIN